MLANLVKLTVLLVVLVNVVESKPASNCQKCLNDSSNYIDHYHYLNCKAIASKDCPHCIERFDCPRLPLIAEELDTKKCHVGTSSFSVGESILSKRKFCKYCTCVDVPLPPTGPVDYEDNGDDDGDDSDNESENTQPPVDFNATAILMSRREPPAVFNPAPVDSNYVARVTCAVGATPLSVIMNSPDSNEYCFYKENECHHTKHCQSKEKLEKEHCQYQGKKYAFGEMIYPDEEDRCLKCKCGSNWTNNISQMIKQCERLACDMEDQMLNQGCVPIYENKCCPNNYHCPSEEVKKKEPFKTGKCYFNGKNYDVGSKLKTDNPCMVCTCKVPPYHTCTMLSNCED